MAALTEGLNVGDLILMEGDLAFSTDEVTVADGEVLTIGSVIGIQTADGKAYVLAPAAVDGTEVAAGVMREAAAPSGADVTARAIVRHSILKSSGVVWPGGITVPQQAAAVLELKALQVLIYTGA